MGWGVAVGTGVSVALGAGGAPVGDKVGGSIVGVGGVGAAVAVPRGGSSLGVGIEVETATITVGVI